MMLTLQNPLYDKNGIFLSLSLTHRSPRSALILWWKYVVFTAFVPCAKLINIGIKITFIQKMLHVKLQGKIFLKIYKESIYRISLKIGEYYNAKVFAIFQSI